MPASGRPATRVSHSPQHPDRVRNRFLHAGKGPLFARSDGAGPALNSLAVGDGRGPNEPLASCRCLQIRKRSGTVVVQAGLAEAICGEWIRVPSRSGEGFRESPSFLALFLEWLQSAANQSTVRTKKHASHRIREPAASSRRFSRGRVFGLYKPALVQQRGRSLDRSAPGVP